MKIYVTRAVLGFVGGVLAGLMKWSLPHIGFSSIVMGSLYIVTIIFAYRLYTRNGIYRLKPIFLEGIGAYLFIWLLVWAMLYNILVIYS